MTPQPPTAAYISRNDRQFAEQVAVNNRTCGEAPACEK